MSFFEFPELDLAQEKAEEIIEKIARFIVNKGMGTPAILFLQPFYPLSYIGAQMGLFFGSAFLPLIPGNWGYNLVGLFSDKQNVEKLMQRIEELMAEEEEKEKLEKEKRKEEKAEGKRSLRSLFKLHRIPTDEQ